jgi:hypothetical protein
LNGIEEHSCQVFARKVGGNSKIWPSDFSEENCITSEDTELFSVLILEDETR